MTTAERLDAAHPLDAGHGTRTVQIVAGAVTGATAVSGYTGVMGLVGGSVSLGTGTTGRPPFGTLVLAAFTLFWFVAVPMTVAALAALRPLRHANDIVFGAGVLLVAWVAVETAYLDAYAWFHPAYLGVAALVLSLAWVAAHGGSALTPADHERPGVRTPSRDTWPR
jgi:hypothetical protein